LFWQEHSDGWGLPPMHRFTSRGPLQHGETNIDFRLDPRILNLVGGTVRDNQAKMQAARSRLMGVFKPSNAAILLRWDLADGTVRQIDTYYSDGMSMPIGHVTAGRISSQNQSGETALYGEALYQRTAIELVAPDPTFYDPTAHVVTITNTSFGSGMPVPLPVPFSVGPSTMSVSQAIAYDGDWLTYPVLRLIGPLTDPVVRNTTTGEILDFTGATINAGDFWDIDLGYAAKTVTDAAGNSQMAYLVDGSDLGTFHLAATPTADAPYSNTLTLVAGGSNSQSSLRVMYYSRFIGL
jgi:hypothetical protein